jgi:hypothetical protein
MANSLRDEGLSDNHAEPAARMRRRFGEPQNIVAVPNPGTMSLNLGLDEVVEVLAFLDERENRGREPDVAQGWDQEAPLPLGTTDIERRRDKQDRRPCHRSASE